MSSGYNNILRLLLAQQAGGGGFRYWRILINAKGSGFLSGFQEVQFRGAPGGADLTSPALATARAIFSEERSGDEASMAFDDDVNTRWLSSTTVSPQWIGWDFGSGEEVTVNEVFFRNVSSGISPTSVTIQSSQNNVTWADEWSVTSGLTTGTGSENTLTRP